MTAQFQSSDSAQVPWRKSDFADGVWVKDLGQSDGRAMQMVRFDPGARFPLHRHEGPEMIFVLAGEVVQHGTRLSPGWAGIAAAGTEEGDFFSATGATFLIVYSQ